MRTQHCPHLRANARIQNANKTGHHPLENEVKVSLVHPKSEESYPQNSSL